MTKALLPQAFWFRIAAPCLRWDEMPRTDNRKALLDLPSTCILPNAGRMEGLASWADVRIAWNPRGIGIAVHANGVEDVQLERDRPEGFADIQFWVDTRDTRDVSRATRFCHRFTAAIHYFGITRKLDVEVVQRPIARAVADAPISKAGLIESRADLTRSGWSLEVFLPAQVLNGFDHETNRRLGFAYQISDHVRNDQFMGVGRDFPIGENPSLWSTIDLKD